MCSAGSCARDNKGLLLLRAICFLHVRAFQWLEDRQNTAFASPTCYTPQLSTLISSSVSAAGDVINATWSRPIEINDTEIAAGYLNIPEGPSHFIAALLNGTAPTSNTQCQVLQAHSLHAGAPVTFLPVAPPGQLCIESECFTTIGWRWVCACVPFSVASWPA